MTGEAAERRFRRAAAQQVFDALALEYLDVVDVRRGRMFGSEGLLLNGKFFAFVGRDGQLIVKLSAVQAAALVAGGEATAVQAGRGATREWVGIPMPADGSAGRWRGLVADAYRYALSHTPPSKTEP